MADKAKNMASYTSISEYVK